MQRDLRDVRALVRHTIESPLAEECVQKIPDTKVMETTNDNDQRCSPFQMTSTPDPEIVQIATVDNPQIKEEPVEEDESENLSIYSFLINNLDVIINKLGSSSNGYKLKVTKCSIHPRH